MNVADRYRHLAARFTALLEAVPADRWDSPSPCEGWSAADVVDHVVSTEGDLLGRMPFAPETPPAGSDRVAVWREVRDLFQRALADPDRLGDARPLSRSNALVGSAPTPGTAKFERLCGPDVRNDSHFGDLDIGATRSNAGTDHLRHRDPDHPGVAPGPESNGAGSAAVTAEEGDPVLADPFPFGRIVDAETFGGGEAEDADLAFVLVAVDLQRRLAGRHQRVDR